MIEQRKKIFTNILYAGDLGATLLAFGLAYSFRGGFPSLGFADLFPFVWYLELLWIIFPVWSLTFFACGLYQFWRGPGFWKEAWGVFEAVFVSFFILGFAIFVLRYQFVSRIFLFLFFFLNIPLVLLLRVLVRQTILFLNWKNGHDRAFLIVGGGEGARLLLRVLEKHRDLGLRVLGILWPGGSIPEKKIAGYPVLGQALDLLAIVENQVVDEVIFAVPQEDLQKYEDLFLLCKERGITTRILLELFPHSIDKIYVEEFDGLPLLSFSSTSTNELLLMVRRILDMAGSFLLLAILSPLFLLIGFFIRLDSSGPAIYRQIRCGLNGRKFWFYKFRSMIDGAEQQKGGLTPYNLMNGPVFKMENDPRITRVGRFLRKSSLDEIPQLFNVLRGDMSLVGPRPPLPEEVAQYKGWQKRRLSMKPGITGLWQVSGRNLLDFDDWMKMDLAYIDHWSLWLDLKILLKTIPAVFSRKGAM
jgi:exopolysaccharide biosynthesis polyprenyl glycosylphosphotransferase